MHQDSDFTKTEKELLHDRNVKAGPSSSDNGEKRRTSIQPYMRPLAVEGRQLSFKRGLRKKESKGMEEKRLKEEFDDIFGEDNCDGFMDRVSSVYHPFQNKLRKIESNEQESRSAALTREGSENDNESMCLGDDAQCDDGRSVDSLHIESNALPVGYYNASLRAFCRVTPKYGVGKKKSKKREKLETDGM